MMEIHDGGIVRQGCKTSTVLTNSSDFITIIDDRDREKAKKTMMMNNEHFLPVKMGLRTMHKSSILFGEWSDKSSFKSTTKSEFSGRKDLNPSRRPKQFPSQHHNNFPISSSDCNLNKIEAKRSSYVTIQDLPLHEHKVVWKREMSGNNMLHSLSYNLNNQNFSTTTKSSHNSDVHQTKGLRTKIHRHSPSSTFNRITNNTATQNDHSLQHHRISGNKTLHETRNTHPNKYILD